MRPVAVFLTSLGQDEIFRRIEEASASNTGIGFPFRHRQGKWLSRTSPGSGMAQIYTDTHMPCFLIYDIRVEDGGHSSRIVVTPRAGLSPKIFCGIWLLALVVRAFSGDGAGVGDIFQIAIGVAILCAIYSCLWIVDACFFTRNFKRAIDCTLSHWMIH